MRQSLRLASSCATTIVLGLQVSPLVSAAHARQIAPAAPTPEVKALIDQAQLQMQQFHWDAALAQLTSARDKARVIGDEDGECVAQLDIGLVYARTAKYGQAQTCFSQALQLARKVRDTVSEFFILLSSGSTYGNAGRPKEAIPSLIQALTLAKTLKDVQGAVFVLTGIGAARAKNGQPVMALDAYKQALSLTNAKANPVGF